MLITYFCRVMNQQGCSKNVPAKLTKVFLKVINVYYQEAPAATNDLVIQIENYKNYISS